MDLSQFKFHIFFLALLMVYPLSRIIYKDKRLKKILMALSIFSTLLLYKYLDINFVSMEIYRGTVRGFEISILDLMALSLFLALQYDRRVKKQLVIPGFWLNAVYVGCAVLSLHLSNAEPNLTVGYFAIFQYLRGLFYYWVLYHLIEDESDFRLIINTMLCIAFYSTFIALQQRYIQHFYRISGLFSHPNILGVYSNMIGIFLLFIFRENIIKKRNGLIFTAAVLSLATVMLTISRAAIATAVCGIIMILGTLYLGKSELSVKKIAASLAIIFVISLIWFKAGNTILARWTEGNPAGDELRTYLSRTASELSGTNMFGCGINNFSYVSKKLTDLDLPPTHNVYYLQLAELGYTGLTVFLLIWARFIFMGLKQFFIQRRSLINSVIKAAAIVCILMLINSLQEDHPRRTAIMYLYIVYWACIAKGTTILKDEAKDNSHSAPVC